MHSSLAWFIRCGAAIPIADMAVCVPRALRHNNGRTTNGRATLDAWAETCGYLSTLGRCAAEFRTRILQHPDRTEFWAYGKQAPGPSRHPSSIVSLRPIATLELSGSSKREQLGVISPRHLRKLHYTIVCLQDDNARLCTPTPYKKNVLWEPLRVADFSRAKRRGRH